jgi:hypothetical protein
MVNTSPVLIGEKVGYVIRARVSVGVSVVEEVIGRVSVVSLS